MNTIKANRFAWRIRIVISYAVLIIILILQLLSPANANLLPLPNSQKIIPSYTAVASPVITGDSAESLKPIAVGNVATQSGDLHIQVATGTFASPMDAYFGIIAKPIAPDILFLVDEKETLQAFTGVPILWKTNVSSLNEVLLGHIRHSDLPAGDYTLYLLLTPAGSDLLQTNLLTPAGSDLLQTNFYLWSSDLHLESTDVISSSAGHSIEFPSDSLPADASVTIQAGSTPILPQGFEAIGQALNITSNRTLRRPATLRFSLPGGHDPEKLTILRVENNGNLTLLSTRVEGNYLLAETPGFSSFIISKLQEELTEETSSQIIPRLSIVGPSFLGTNETRYYEAILKNKTNTAFRTFWTINGDALLNLTGERQSSLTDHLIPVRGGDKEELVTLTAETIYEELGINLFASFNISVQAAENLDHQLYVTFGRSDDEKAINTFIAGVDSFFRATLFLFRHVDDSTPLTGPIRWSWDFGDNSKNAQDDLLLNEKNGYIFNLPEHSYDVPGTYTFRASAKHLSSGRSGDIRMTVYVLADTLSATSYGPEPNPLTWSDPSVTGTFTVKIQGGIPPYVTQWQILPASSSSLISEKDNRTSIEFLEPGSYLLTTKVLDSEHNETQSRLPITIQGGLALNLNLSGLPRTTEVSSHVSAILAIKGGRRVVAGAKRGYTVMVDWGDGTIETMKDVGLANDYIAGATIPLSHTYNTHSEAGIPFIIKAKVVDATDNKVEIAHAIVVEEASTTIIDGFGYPGRNVCPDSIVSISSAFSLGIYKTYILDDFIDYAGAAPFFFKAICYYTLPNPVSEDVYTSIEMNLFYTDNLFNNGDGCGESSNYYDERFSSAFSWSRVLQADFRGFTAARMKDPMVALGELLDRAANSGVGAACH